MPANLPDRLQTLVVEHLSCPDRFSWEADLRTDLGADSLDVVELAMAIEEAFPGVHIPDDAADRWTTAGDLLASVEELSP